MFIPKNMFYHLFFSKLKLKYDEFTLLLSPICARNPLPFIYANLLYFEKFIFDIFLKKKN